MGRSRCMALMIMCDATLNDDAEQANSLDQLLADVLDAVESAERNRVEIVCLPQDGQTEPREAA